MGRVLRASRFGGFSGSVPVKPRIPCEISIYYQMNIAREFGAFSGGPGGGLARIGRGRGLGAEGRGGGSGAQWGARRGRADGPRHADASRQRWSNATTRREASIRIREADKEEMESVPRPSRVCKTEPSTASSTKCASRAWRARRTGSRRRTTPSPPLASPRSPPQGRTPTPRWWSSGSRCEPGALAEQVPRAAANPTVWGRFA